MEPVKNPLDADSSIPLSPPPAEADSSLPTHHLENIKAGNFSVQLLVSTRNQLYNAKDVEAGEDSWQVIGCWEDGSVSELTQMLSQQSATRSSALSRFSGGYGAGKTLGTFPKQSPGTSK